MRGIANGIGHAALVALGLGLSAGGVAAQQTAALCAGAGDEGVWMRGSEALSDIAAADAPFDTIATVIAGSRHVALFTVSQPMDVRVEALPVADGDTVIDLLSAAGELVLNDDDGGGGLASAGEVYLESGTYCLVTRNYDPADMTASIRVGLLPHDRLTEGMGTAEGGSDHAPCTADTSAFDLALVAGSAMATNPATEVPYYRFAIAEPTALSISADGQLADPYIFLYDASGTLIDSNDDADGLNSRIDLRAPLAPGEYCVAVTALSDASEPITVAVAPFDPERAARAEYASGDVPPPLDGSYPVTDLGLLEGRAQADAQIGDEAEWFLFEVSEPGLVVIEAVAVEGGDPKLTLFDAFGRFVEENDDSGRTLNAKLAARVFAGQHLVSLAPSGGGQSEPVRMRMLIEEYVPK